MPGQKTTIMFYVTLRKDLSDLPADKAVQVDKPLLFTFGFEDRFGGKYKVQQEAHPEGEKWFFRNYRILSFRDK